jgi:exodeoxyribonuclease V alpha subunit
VEAGSVFADLCGQLSSTQFSAEQQSEASQGLGINSNAPQSDYPLADNVVVLDRSHRFDPDAGIGQLASLINQGEADACIQRLRDSEDDPQLDWYQYPEDKIDQAMEAQAKQYYLPLLHAKSVAEAFDTFKRFRILTPVWKGITGVDHINDRVEAFLRRTAKLNLDSDYFAGKPLIMESNLPQYDLHNGDIGILWGDQTGRLQVWFERGDGSYRPLSIAQCPNHRSAFAMTVHKSQGSEFNKVLLIMPFEELEVSTRELLYTAITRASDSVEIWSTETIIRYSIEHPTQRVSGLLERLNETLSS